jgi:peptidoglycan/xylan/chitin deacetylase (PgdA/CDA1 family)
MDSEPAAINILMYHSISTAPGPTSIPAQIFRGQIEILKASGYRTISLKAFMDWHSGKTPAPASRPVVITFDDGFADFADSAVQILEAYECTATIFLPSGKVGGTEDWPGARPGGRKLMTWRQVTDLAARDIEFGGHGVGHRDLTKLSGSELEREIRQCRDQIAQRLGHPPVAFAPPYGRAHERERVEIRKSFDISVGTTLDRADRNCDLHDLPRIEMHYFRDLNRWRGYLEGRAEKFFHARRTLRRIREWVRR